MTELDEETARRSVRPGDVVVTVGGNVVRAAEVEDEDGLLGVRQVLGGDARELTTVAWMDVEDYHPREDDPDPVALLDEVDVQEESSGADVQEAADDGGQEGA